MVGVAGNIGVSLTKFDALDGSVEGSIELQPFELDGMGNGAINGEGDFPLLSMWLDDEGKLDIDIYEYLSDCWNKNLGVILGALVTVYVGGKDSNIVRVPQATSLIWDCKYYDGGNFEG